MILVSFVTTGIKSFTCELRLTTIQRWAWVQLGWRGHILQYLSSWCTTGSVIERQEIVRPAVQALHTVLFSLGAWWILNCVFFFFPVWFSHLHGKIFLVCLDFHCVDNIKGSGMGCGEKGVCSLVKCMFWCLFDSRGQRLMSLHAQSERPSYFSSIDTETSDGVSRYNDIEHFSSSISSYVHDKPAAC